MKWNSIVTIDSFSPLNSNRSFYCCNISETSHSGQQEKTSDQVKREREDEKKQLKMINTASDVFQHMIEKPKLWNKPEMKRIENLLRILWAILYYFKCHLQNRQHRKTSVIRFLTYQKTLLVRFITLKLRVEKIVLEIYQFFK